MKTERTPPGEPEDRYRLIAAAIGTWCQIDIPDVQGRLQAAAVAHQNVEKDVMRTQMRDRRKEARSCFTPTDCWNSRAISLKPNGVCIVRF